jgi:multisubunit Na+/H+ antiporter MnhG subunit
MANPFGWIFAAAWLAAIVLSVPAAFVGAFLVVAKRVESGWQRVILGALFGLVLAPIVFFAAYLLPLTIWVTIPVATIWALVRAARHRGHPNTEPDTAP